MRNWFSSYVYESPTLDTADGFRDSLSKEGECEDDEFIGEESNREKAKDGGEFTKPISNDDFQNSNGLGNYYKNCEDQEKESSNKVLIFLSLCWFCSPFVDLWVSNFEMIKSYTSTWCYFDVQ